FVGIAVDGAAAAETRRVAGDEAHLERARDLLCNLVLDREHVFEPVVERFGPQVITVAGTDELRGHAQAITELAHAPFEDRCDAERSADLADVGRSPLVLKRGGSRRDLEPAHATERIDDLLGDAVAEVIL